MPNRIYDLNDFRVGDKVKHRIWTVPVVGNQNPLVLRAYGYVREIIGKSIWVYFPTKQIKTEFLAFEIIPA